MLNKLPHFKTTFLFFHSLTLDLQADLILGSKNKILKGLYWKEALSKYEIEWKMGSVAKSSNHHAAVRAA